jgi:hypothetical protein
MASPSTASRHTDHCDQAGQIMSKWDEWVLDITNLPTVAFCPVEGEAVVLRWTYGSTSELAEVAS